MKKLLLLILMFSCVINSLSQQKSVDKEAEFQEILIRKQIVVNDLENQIKEIPFAAVRVFAMYKIASWLWKDGKDDLGRAEQIAITAVDDLYENQAEIPPVYFNTLSPELFALLESNAKDAAKKLKEKHKITLKNESGILDSLLNQKDGEKLATDAAIKSLVNQNHKNPEISILIGQLQQRRSPELVKLLTAIVQAEESGRAKFSSDILFLMSGYFIEPSVPIRLQKRFLKVVVDRSRYAAQMPDGDTEGFFSLLSRVMSDISSKFQELFSEASIIQTVLKTRVSSDSRETQERNERIQSSPDKLSALVGEAERTDNKTDKYELYVSAAHLALKLKKFIYSVDLVEKSAEIDMSSNPISEAVRKRWRDQFMGDVAAKFLQSDDPDSASYATKKITDPLTKAESLRKAANYYVDRGDLISAHYALDEGIKFAAKAETTPQSISCLINMLHIAQRIDPRRVFEVNEIVAKSINAIPSLNVEDKPQTENYKSYVTKVMIVNWNLELALTRLVKVNKNAATDLANRIDKKEIGIIANFVLLTDSIVQNTNQKKGQESALLLK